MNTRPDLKAFVRCGWIYLRSPFTNDVVHQLRAWADELTNSEEPNHLKYFERSTTGTKILSRIENFVTKATFPSNLMHPSSPLIQILRDLFRDEPVLFKDKINFKPPGGGGFAIHQDGPAYNGFGISYFLTAMIAIDEASLENGYLEMATGPRIERELKLDENGCVIASELERLEFVGVPVLPGDVLIFDGLVPHRSGPNRSKQSRRAIFLTFNGNKEGDKRGAYYKAKSILFPPEDQRKPDVDYRNAGRQFNLGNPFV